LTDLEQALQKADRELGNDGVIGLPYWDFSDYEGDEVMPKVIRDNFGSFDKSLVSGKGDGEKLLAYGSVRFALGGTTVNHHRPLCVCR